MTALFCQDRSFQCICIPVGLTNASSCIQPALVLILTWFRWNTCLAYLDYVVTFYSKVEDRICHIEKILTTLTEDGDTLKVTKFHFVQCEVEYLGHIVIPRC